MATGAHLSDATVRAFVDGELDGRRQAAASSHAAGCDACRGALAAHAADAAWAGQRLRAYAAVTAAAAPDAEAWPRMKAARAAEGRRRPRAAAAGSLQWTSRPVAAAAAAAVLLGGSFSLQPVRAAALQVLSIFRVQNVTMVNVTAADVQQIAAALEGGHANLNIQGLAHITGTAPAGPRPSTLQAAQGAVSFPIQQPSPKTLPAGYALTGVLLQPETNVSFQLNVAGVNTLLSSLGSAQTLPASLDGATLGLQVPASVLLRYAPPAEGSGRPAAGPILVGEAGNPTLSVPAGVDVSQVRDVLLGLPFLPADLRAQLAAITDWQHTVPIPQISGVSQGVLVGGAQGVFIQAPATGDKAGDGALVWLAGGVVHAVAGPLTVQQAQQIAAGLS